MNWKLIGQQILLVFLVGAYAGAYHNDAPWWFGMGIIVVIIYLARWMVSSAVDPYRKLIIRAANAQAVGHTDWAKDVSKEERRVLESFKFGKK